MTTICTFGPSLTMASESATFDYDTKSRQYANCVVTDKLIKFDDVIAGGAGDVEAIDRFFDWVQSGRPRKLPKIRKHLDLTGLLLFKDGRVRAVDSDFGISAIKDGIAAVGTGAPYALGALRTMKTLGVEVSPVLAVKIATLLDPYSKAPIHFLSWHTGGSGG